jgi:hypothetical protein
MVGNRTADVLLFLDSEAIPGLKVGYDTKERKIKGGLPLLSSEELNVIDGNSHKLEYSFHREMGKQNIFLDGKMIAEGEFTGIRDQNMISGFSVYQKWTKIESPIAIKTSFE